MVIGLLSEDIVNNKQIHVVIGLICKDNANYKLIKRQAPFKEPYLYRAYTMVLTHSNSIYVELIQFMA